jgi:hypothetical protein
MATKHANTLDHKLTYTGAAAPVAAASIINLGARFRMAAIDALDHQVLEIRNVADASSIQVFWDAAAPSSNNLTASVQIRDASSNSTLRSVGNNACQDADVWYSVLATAQLTSTSNCQLDVWFKRDGDVAWTALATVNGTYNNTGSFVLGANDIRIGGRNADKPMNGDIEDVWVSVGSALTSQERTDLLTQSARKALANSLATMAFMPDLTRPDCYDAVSDVTPTVTTPPTRTLYETLDYGWGPTLCIAGDTQKLQHPTEGFPGVALPAFRDRLLALRPSLNMQALLHVGDLVHTRTNQDEWDEIVDALETIVDDMPVLFTLGNHDMAGATRTATEALANFPVTFFSNQAGASAALSPVVYGSDNYCRMHTLTLGDETWLIGLLPMFATAPQLSLMRTQFLAASTDHCLLLTHALVVEEGHLAVGTDDHAPSTYSTTPASTDPGGETGWWNQYFADIPKLRLAYGGHFITGAASHPHEQIELTGAWGNNTLARFLNWQENSATGGKKGGDGLVDFVTLEADGSITIRSYFALTGLFSTYEDNFIEHTVIEADEPPAPTLNVVDLANINAMIQAALSNLDSPVSGVAAQLDAMPDAVTSYLFSTPGWETLATENGVIYAKLPTTTMADAAELAAAKAAVDALPTPPTLEQIVAGVETNPTTPISQVAVPLSRTWILTLTAAGLVGQTKRYLRVGSTDQLFAIDFRHDLPTNGRGEEVVSIVIADGEAGGVTFGDASVDKSQAKIKLTAVTPGEYQLLATVDYDDASGGGRAKAKVILVVTE